MRCRPDGGVDDEVRARPVGLFLTLSVTDANGRIDAADVPFQSISLDVIRRLRLAGRVGPERANFIYLRNEDLVGFEIDRHQDHECGVVQENKRSRNSGR